MAAEGLCAYRGYVGGVLGRAVSLAVALAIASCSVAYGVELRPDVDMQAPSGIQVTTASGRSFVAFESRVDNHGPGVLKLLGQRPSTSTSTMSVTQVLLNTGSVSTGTVERAAPGVGTMQFSPAGGHNHWHLLRFEDYMLLSVPDLAFVAPTRKTGFCLSGLRLSFSCGSNDTSRLEIGDPAEAAPGAGPAPDTEAMGLIVPNGPDFNGNRQSFDIYTPTVEGQDIEITGVPDGRYCLSFVANPEERIVETTTENNGASRLIDVGTVGRSRSVGVGQAFDDSATCGLTTPAGTTGPGGAGPGPSPAAPAPVSADSGITPAPVPPPRGDTSRAPLLTMRTAAKLSRTALEQKFRTPRRLSRACRLTRASHATCAVAFQQSAARYRGRVAIKQLLRGGEWKWFYAIDVRRTRRVGCRSCPRRVKTKTLLGGVLGVDPAAARRALSLPAGRPVPTRRGAAWADSRLCRISRAALAQRKPVG